MTSEMSPQAAVSNGSDLPDFFSTQPKVLFTDVDDTLTCDGVLPETTYSALHRLFKAGVVVVPVTGASAGWCDCLIKTWPIKHIIGENGALAMLKDEQGIVTTHLATDQQTIASDMAKLRKIGVKLSEKFPVIQHTQDQPFRLTDVAFDIGQFVTVNESVAEQATQWLRRQGVQAHRSSIHINAWLGDHSKATGALRWLSNRNMTEKDCVFIGDSPNDESMFKHFSSSVGVANVGRFLSSMEHVPIYVTKGKGGYGFVELAKVLLKE